MSPQRKVLVVGSINVDCTVRVNELPKRGETIHGAEPLFLPGGKGGNQAISVVGNGAEAIMIGAVGLDDHGLNAMHSLKEAGVETQAISQKSGATGTAYIFVEDAGENLIVVTSGANGAVSAQEVEEKISQFGGDNPVILAQLELPLAAVNQAAISAEKMGGRFILNLAPAEKIGSELLAKCDPIIVNENEAEVLTGKTISSINDAKALVVELAALAKSAVITLGADGAVFAVGKAAEATHLPSQKVVVVDTTGAGDAFVGALAAAFSKGQDLSNAVSAGLKAGAKAVQHFGAQAPKN
ncbi:MAG: hypothetical protein RL723_640 [Actinomycetota bacterium]|jgi:ribokinase